MFATGKIATSFKTTFAMAVGLAGSSAVADIAFPNLDSSGDLMSETAWGGGGSLPMNACRYRPAARTPLQRMVRCRA